MEYFNFSHLPLLVKEMIADEIVHNSIPEDRIQFATTCKAFNQLVKHAKPKKIINCLRLQTRTTDVSVFINSGNERRKTLSELKNILQQYQVKNLSIEASISILNMHIHSKVMDLLMESCRFVTALSISSFDPEFNYVDFYKKLKHLKSLIISDTSGMIMDLPYFPPKLILRSEYSLSLLAEKTKNHPLSFLKITEEVSLTDIQQFLMRANLDIGAEIHVRFESFFKGFLTFIGDGLFEFQMLRGFKCLILDQQMNSENKKILKLSTDFDLNRNEKVPLIMKSVSNPDDVVCSGELTDEFPGIVSENVAEFIKVMSPDYPTYYSPQLLDNWFPRTENYDPFERVETINKTLGTNIVVISPEMREER